MVGKVLLAALESQNTSIFYGEDESKSVCSTSSSENKGKHKFAMFTRFAPFLVVGSVVKIWQVQVK